MNYILYLDWGALVIYSVILINMIFKKYIRTKKSDIFLMLIIIAVIANVFDIVATFMLEYAAVVPLWLDYATNIIYFLSFNAIAPIYLLYIIVLTGRISKIKKQYIALIAAPYAVSAFFILSTPFTKWVFFFTDTFVYTHGPMLYALYAIAEAYQILVLILTIRSKGLTKEQSFCSYFFMAGNIIAIFVQMLVPELLISQFSISVSILLIFMTLQNPEDFYNRAVGLLNRIAFLTVLSEKIENRKPIEIVALRVCDLGYISSKLGLKSTEDILRQVIGELTRLSVGIRFFELVHGKYVFLADADKNIFSFLPEKIKKIFSVPFVYNGLSVSLSAPICCISYPQTTKDVEDVMVTIDYYLETKAYDGGNIMWADKDVLEGHAREEALLNLLRVAVADDGFDVAYQPIYSASDGAFTEAEALVRLKSNEALGYVSPEEFIPLAEKNGLIEKIGEFVVRKVCEFLSSGIRPQVLRHVNINLSVVQCMREDMHEKLTAIIDGYGVDHSLITLEITETSAAYSSDTLISNMKKLISNGIDFAMDDYGSGFSGTGYLIDYPFAIVKLDKHIVWEAFKNRKAMSVLKNTVSMIKEMSMTIVAEGVETKEQERTLLNIGCDMLQGFLYSKPVPVDELITFLTGYKGSLA